MYLDMQLLAPVRIGYGDKHDSARIAIIIKIQAPQTQINCNKKLVPAI
jgi:hypothetical protein